MAVTNPRDYPIDDSSFEYVVSKESVPAAQTNLVVGRISLSRDCVVKRVAASCRLSTGGAARGTVDVFDGTNSLFSADATLVSAGTVVVTETSTPNLVRARQARDAAQVLQVRVDTPASEVVSDLNVVITCTPTPRNR